MLSARTAWTRELDDPELATNEILEQLDTFCLKENSVGILFCEQEFVDNGIVERIFSRLDFPIIGGLTTFSAVPGAADSLQLSLMVLTGDGVKFAGGLSDPFGDDPEARVRELPGRVLADLGCEPKLILTVGPMLFKPGMDDEKLVLAIKERLGPGTPLFGTLACNYRDGRYDETRVLFGGGAYADRLAMLAVGGDVHPGFRLERMPDNRILRKKAIITKSDHNMLMEVNDKPILDYLSELGLIVGGNIVGCHSYPFVLGGDDDGEPVSRTIYGITPEGYVHCGGEMPVGATLSVAAQDVRAVLGTAGEVVDAAGRLKEAGDLAAALFFSCHSRSVTLGLDESGEADLVASALGEGTPYLFMYSGGEICPRIGSDGTLDNAFHCDTIVGCFFSRGGEAD